MPRSEGGDKSVSGKCLTSQDDAPMLRAGATLRKRQGRLLRKYALVGGALIAGSLVQLYFSYQQSQAAVLQIERVEASRAALAISQFVDSMKAQIVGILPAPGLGDVPCEQRRADFLSLQRRAPEIDNLSFIDRNGKEQVRVSRLALNLTCHGQIGRAHV